MNLKSAILRTLVVLSLMIPTGIPAAAVASQPEPEAPLAAGVIVRYKEEIPAGVASLAGGSSSATANRPALLSVPRGKDAEVYAAEVSRRPDVLWAEPDYALNVTSLASPTDPDYLDASTVYGSGVTYYNARSWWLRTIGAPSAWARGYGDVTPLRGEPQDFRVAVIDTGCWMNHPDIGENIVVGYDLFQSYTAATRKYVQDMDVTPVAPGTQGLGHSTSSHGTSVAAAIAGAVNDVGMVGVGGDTQVAVYKVMGIWTDAGDYGGTNGMAAMLTSAVTAAIYRATDDGCRVINMSLGGYERSQALQSSIDYARSRGVIVVAAMGNDNDPNPFYPAGCDGVIGVTATALDASGAEVKASFSNYGTGVDLAAPGVVKWLPITPGYDADGVGTMSRPGYTFWAGTSMASPVVAGTAAFIWRAAPGLGASEVEQLLSDTAVDLGTPGRDDHFGKGRVDIEAAYLRLARDYAPPGTPVFSLPPYSRDPVVTISWPAIPGTGVVYEVSIDGGTPIKTTARSYATPSLGEGSHTVAVRTVTSGRNWPSPWASRTLVVDTVVPTVSSLALTGGWLTWIGSGTGSACSYEVAVDGDVAKSGLTESRYFAGDLALGDHLFAVRATDAAGNMSGWVSATLDLPKQTFVKPSRFAGNDRYATAITTSRGTYAAGTVTEAVVVSGENWPDALSAGPLAAGLKGPLLLTRKDSLATGLVGELRRAGVTRVTLVGGSGALSEENARALRGSGFRVRRIAGENRYDTAALVAAEVRVTFGAAASDRVFLASGDDYPDALAAGAVASGNGSPVLLVSATGLTAATRSTLASGGYTQAVLAGGPGAVPAVSVPGMTVKRVYGADRYSTAAAVATYALKEGLVEPTTVGLASGRDFPDALAAAPVLARTHGVLLLTDPRSLSRPAAGAIDTIKMRPTAHRSLLAFGGVSVLPATTLQDAADRFND